MADGYGLDEKGIKALATKMAECAADLQAAERPVLGRGCPSDNETGEFATGAFNTFFGAWSEETKITVDALKELSRKFNESAATYASTEQAEAHNLGRMMPN